METYTHSAQNDVLAFHRAVDGGDAHVGQTPGLRNHNLRVSLIQEEAQETCDAIQQGDLVEAIDGLCDLIYVAYGAAIEFGIDLGPFWDEVQKTNMAKAGGPKRADGKCMKPPGWVPPDIAGILASQEAS